MSEKNFKPDSSEKSDVGGISILNVLEPVFKEPLKDVHTAELPIAGCAWIDTNDGVVLIDTLLNSRAAEKVMERIKGNIKYIIYTHGHYDHVGGAKAFMKDNPEIISNKHLPDRLDKYEILAPYRTRITAMQFNIPEEERPIRNVVRPTKTFIGDFSFTLGGKTFELHTARAETDDACWIYVPELKSAFIGDLIIGNSRYGPQFPNVGNPWKPTRYALDWAKELERVRALEPENIFCNGGSLHIEGKQVKEALNAHIEVIRSMHDQVVEYINQDMHITEMIHAVSIPDHLKTSPYLNTTYSRPEFFVYNVYRWYHGYFDHNPAHLIPRPEKEVVTEIFELIGSSGKVLKRSEELLIKGKFQLALEVLDVLIQTQPDNIEARKLRMKILKKIGRKDSCLMSRNTWHYFFNKDKEFLSSLNK